MRFTCLDFTARRFARFTTYLSLSALAGGIVLFPINPRAALLPVAVVFGWTQIGGL